MPIHPENLTHPSQAKTSASTTTEPPWDPNHLSDKHIEMIKQHVRGVPFTKIAYSFKRHGVSISGRHIRRVVESPKGREFASLYSAQLHNGMVGLVDIGAGYAPEATFVELEMFRNPLTAERHRLGAAQDFMDRFGPPKISRQENQNPTPTTIHITLSASQLSQFAAPPPMIEAEVVSLPEHSSNTTDD